MIGINRKDIQAILKAGAKTKGMSTSEFKAEIQATIDNIISSSIYTPIRKIVEFIDYDSLVKQYENESKIEQSRVI